MDQSHRLSVVSDVSAPKYYPEEEIDIKALLLTLYGQWRFVLSIVAGVTVMAIVGVLVWPKVYEVKAITGPPELELIKVLNRNAVNPYTTEEVYSEYFNKLTQMDVARRYFEETEFYRVISDKDPGRVFTPFEIDNAYTAFQKNFQVEKVRLDYLELNKNEKTPLSKVSIVLKTRNPAAAAEFINGFIHHVEEKTLQKFYSDQLALKQLKKNELEGNIKALKEKTRVTREAQIAALEEQNTTKIRGLEDTINALMKEAEFNRQARIAQLKEALFIAKTLNVEEPRSLDDFRPENKSQSQVEVSTHLDKDQRPLYLLGTKFLSAEIEQLSKRARDEYFVPELSGLQKELALAKTNRQIETLKQREDDQIFIESLPEIQNQLVALELATLDFSGARLYQLEQKAYVPQRAISPNKKMVVTAAFLGSMMLALCLAFFKAWFKGTVEERPVVMPVADHRVEAEKPEFDSLPVRQPAVKVATKVASAGKL